jgi:hypothetical protein
MLLILALEDGTPLTVCSPLHEIFYFYCFISKGNLTNFPWRSPSESFCISITSNYSPQQKSKCVTRNVTQPGTKYFVCISEYTYLPCFPLTWSWDVGKRKAKTYIIIATVIEIFSSPAHKIFAKEEAAIRFKDLEKPWNSEHHSWNTNYIYLLEQFNDYVHKVFGT